MDCRDCVLRFSSSPDRLELYIDSRNSNEWTLCASLPNLGLPRGWLEKAHVGVTATTGQLADNHDVLYLKTFSNATVLEEDEQAEFSDTHFEIPDHISPEEKMRA